MIKFFKSLFNRQDPVTNYLSGSVDLYDLENRLKELRRKGIWV